MKATQEAWWIVDQLVQQGVKQFCIAPGSRNSPLILAAAEHPLAETIVHFDERGLGFYALGYGKGNNHPAAILVTSGTAVGNLLPSIMEAYHSETPMILLTADRPTELRDCGANQACDQVKIFSSFLRWETDTAPSGEESYFRSLVAQGLFHALANPAGPIQINCQFREPFLSLNEPLSQGKPISFSFPKLISAPVTVRASKGAILIGKLDSDVQPILELAKRLQWPVFADILSNARSYPTQEQICHFDPILKTESVEKPEFVLHFGTRLTSKKILDWPVDMHVAKTPYLQDPSRKVLNRVQSDIDSFCASFQSHSDPNWLSEWKEKDLRMKEKLSLRFSSSSCFTESAFIKQLSELLPSDCAVFLGNGMPIREADLFLFPRKVAGFFANRGLSGIDGNIATAAGLTESLQLPIVTILGDQTCLHDLNSLPLLKKTNYPLILILSNNFGGGIFSHLPVSKSTHFETHISAAHPWTFAKAAQMFDIPYYTSLKEISFENSCVIEIQTSRVDNYRFHKI